MKAVCGCCGVEFEKCAGHLNRANKLGVPVFCTKEHFWMSRRLNETPEQKKAKKAAYDKQYCKTEKRKESAKAYNATPAGRATQKRSRIKLKEYHNEYCRQPEYRANKVDYDRERVAKMNYGEFWECAILTEQINKTLTKMADKQDLRTIQGTNNKSKRRKKQWLRLMKNLPQLT